MNIGARTALWSGKGGAMEIVEVLEDASGGEAIMAWVNSIGLTNDDILILLDDQTPESYSPAIVIFGNGRFYSGNRYSNGYTSWVQSSPLNFLRKGDRYQVIRRNFKDPTPRSNGGGGYNQCLRLVKSLAASFSSLSRYLRKEVAR